MFNIKLCHPDAIIPDKAYDGDAGYDLYACEDIKILPNKRYFVPVGIKTEFPANYVCLIKDRSSTTKNYFCVAGVIDSGFRGSWLVQIIGRKKYAIKKGEKIAQFLVLPCWNGKLNIVDEVSDSERGNKKLGSSGKHRRKKYDRQNNTK